MSDQITINETLATKWEKGRGQTLRFYRIKARTKAQAFNLKKLALPAYFESLIDGKKKVTIAELGAGMFCTIGSFWPQTQVKVYPSDALAEEFNQILKNQGIKPFIRVKKQNMENLTYPDNFFDIVHCCNALDHCFNPMAALLEMHRVCRPGGYIYLRHAVNEGEFQRYNGLHLWNLKISPDKDLIIWNPEYRFRLSRYLPGFKHTLTKKSGREVNRESSREKIISLLKKT